MLGVDDVGHARVTECAHNVEDGMSQRRWSQLAIGFLAPTFIATGAIGAEPAWWTQQKIQCGLSSGTYYNDWVRAGRPCPRASTGGGGASLEAAGQAGFALGRQIREELDRQAEIRRQEELARRATLEAQEREEAERQRIQADASRDRLLNALRGLEGAQPGSATLEGSATSSDGLPFRFTTGAAVPLGSSSAPLLRSTTPEGGRPIFDCQEANQAIPRLNALLEDLRTNPTQQMAVQRTEALSKRGDKEIANLRKEQDALLAKFALEELFGALESTRKAQTLLRRYIDEPTYEPVGLAQLSSSLGDLESEILRGQDISRNAVDRAIRVMRGPERVEALLESIADPLTKAALATRLGGPLGEVAIRTGRFSIAHVALSGQELEATLTRNWARDALEGLHIAERRAREKIDTYRANLADVSRGQALCLADVSGARPVR